ncbi:MAG: glutamate ABC transporter substrate-binding protein [Acidimicrobiia bacterium]
MKRFLQPWFALFAAVVLVVSGCGGDDETATPEPEVEETPGFAAGSTMARLAEAGAIRIGTKIDQPGLGNINLETDAPEGFDVEVGKIIAGKLGIEPDGIEWVETVSANRESFIANDRVDLVIATYTINDKRKETIDFAGPYYVAGQDLLVAADDESITGPDTLAGKRVCAATGSTPIQNIRTNYPQAEAVEFDTYTECVDQLEAGQIDAVSTDDIILAGYAADPKYEGKFRVVGKKFSEEPYGIGLKKGDTDFRNFLNDTLEAIFEDGSWKAAFDATLGSSGVEAPDPPAVNRY